MKKEIFPRAFFGFCVGVTIERFITLLISFGIGQGEFQPVMPFLLDKLPSVRMGALVQTVWCGMIGVTFFVVSGSISTGSRRTRSSNA